MSTTFSTLKTEVAELMRDPDMTTFDDSAVGRMVNMAIAEIGRIAPQHFQEDITPVENTLDYILRSDYFGGEAVPEIEVMRVELWTGAEVPSRQLIVVPSAYQTGSADSEAGWTNWGGNLHIPHRIWSVVDGNEADYLYRVWGYSPYAQCSADADLFDGSDELKWALVAYANIMGVQRLKNERELFKQWQTRSGNSDISPAGLMGDYSRMREEWKNTKHELFRHRVKA